MLTESERERYKRQIGIDGWGEDAQIKLKNSTLFVAGAGGLGGPVIYYLAAAGVGSIRICDSDVVDLTNLNRQILHTESSIGKKKTESAVERIREFNPDVKISCIDLKIDSDNAESLIAGSDIVIDCLDNFKTRFFLNSACVKTSVPLVHAGVMEFQGQVSFFNPPHTACLACIFPNKDSFKKPDIAGVTPGVVGSIQAMEALKYLTGIGENLRNIIMFFDGRSMTFEKMKISKNPECMVCGK